MLKGFTRSFKPFEILAEAEVEAIWDGILDVLDKRGLKFEVESEQVLKIFDGAGCIVDYDTKVVRFPPDLVRDCLSLCPSIFRLESRDPKNVMVVGGDKIYVQPGPGMNYMDIDTFQPRAATKKELYDGVTVYDALPNLHYFHPLSPCMMQEGVPPSMALLEVFVAKFRNSTKVNETGATIPGEHTFAIEIAKVVGHNVLWGVGASPPLNWSGDRIDGFMAAAEAGFPISVCSGATWGASAPATIAGQIISASAECIGAIVLIQLQHPGHPVQINAFTFPSNMKNGAPFFGNIAIGLSNTAFHQVWRRYGIPMADIEPSIPNSKCMDFQSGYEKGMLALASALSGVHMLWIHGCVHGELTAHPVQAILDDDISGMVGRFIEGVEVNDETLAIELIKQIGSGPDFYLNKEHTRNWWAKEQFIPAVADTTTLPEWIQGGKKTAVDLAKERMEDILATHKVSIPLTPSQDEDIERILAEARKFFEKTGWL